MQAAVNQTIDRICAQYSPAPNPPALERAELILRPLCSDDVEGILEMHGRLSQESVYMRYLHAYKPTYAQVEKLLSEVISKGSGFAAVNPSGEIAGFGYYLRDPNDEWIAEPAMIVEDRYQGHGIGTAMMRLLSLQASRTGLRALRAWVDPANRRMLHMTGKLGFPSRRRFVDGMMEVQFSLTGEA